MLGVIVILFYSILVFIYIGLTSCCCDKTWLRGRVQGGGIYNPKVATNSFTGKENQNLECVISARPNLMKRNEIKRIYSIDCKKSQKWMVLTWWCWECCKGLVVCSWKDNTISSTWAPTVHSEIMFGGVGLYPIITTQ